MHGGGSKGQENLFARKSLSVFPIFSLVFSLLVYRFHPLGNEIEPHSWQPGTNRSPTT
jgi:hypothetical protein